MQWGVLTLFKGVEQAAMSSAAICLSENPPQKFFG
jgi:hypothetical protein